ncbi:hypothetical protein GGX14DRAFT_540298, partial [Mycena pura]
VETLACATIGLNLILALPRFDNLQRFVVSCVVHWPGCNQHTRGRSVTDYLSSFDGSTCPSQQSWSAAEHRPDTGSGNTVIISSSES